MSKKQIPQTEWLERLLTISSGNRGRRAMLEADGVVIARQMPFRDIEYDPADKGSDLVIAMGEQDSDLRHVIQNPMELFLVLQSDGEVSSMEIVDKSGKMTVISFS
ncbi:MAG: DUF5335 family protein [Bacteroidales bacterium]